MIILKILILAFLSYVFIMLILAFYWTVRCILNKDKILNEMNDKKPLYDWTDQDFREWKYERTLNGCSKIETETFIKTAKKLIEEYRGETNE